MTISTETERRKRYTGNGTTDTYAYDFKIFAKTDLVVTKITIADGTEEVLTVDSDYTVTGVGNVGGGTVVLTAGNLSSDYRLVIHSDLTQTQGSDYQENDSFPAETLESNLDRLTILVQDLQVAINRSLLQSIDYDAAIEFPTAVANKVIGWNAAGDGLENKETSETAVADAQAAQAAAEAAQAAAETAETNAETAETGAEAAQTAAEAAQTAAEAAQAALDLPTIEAGDAGKILEVNSGEDGYDLVAKTSNVTAVALSIDGGAVATDASAGSLFTLTADGNFTLSDPTNLTNGQMIIWRIKQDATGNRTITLDSIFRLGADISSVTLSTGANKVDYLVGYYDSTDAKIDIISFVKGY